MTNACRVGPGLVLLAFAVSAFGDDDGSRCMALSNSLIKDMPNISTDEANRRMAEAQKCVEDMGAQRAASIPKVTFTGNCPTTLAYLDSRLPRYPGDAEYTTIRNMAVQTDLVEALEKARQMGLTPAQAADQAMQQTKVAEAAERGMADVARAYNNAGEATLVRLKNGTYPANGTLPLPLQGYLAAYVGAVVNKEATAGIACIARHQGR
jgi:hypothetical protein